MLRTFTPPAVFRVVALLCAFLQACSPSDPSDVDYDEKFNPYISAFTSGEISRGSDIRIELADAAIPYDRVGDTLAEHMLSFTPPIKGTATWENVRTVRFTPKYLLPYEQGFRGEFLLGGVYRQLPESMSRFPFGFRTRKQDADLIIYGLESTGDPDSELRKLTGYLFFSDVEDTAVVRQLLSATQDGKSLPLRWSEPSGLKHPFTVDSVVRKDEKGKVELMLDKSAIGIRSRGVREVQVPALGDFMLQSHSIDEEDGQTVVLRFSDPVNAAQDLKGLITIDGHEVRLEKEGSTVRVYPEDFLVGEFGLRVDDGLRSAGGFRLQNGGLFKVRFEDIRPDIRIENKGVIMPRSGGRLPFAFQVVNMDRIRVSIKRIHEKNILQFLQVNDLRGDDEMYRVGEEIFNEVVPLHQESKYSLKRWNTQVLDLAKLVNAEPGAIYHVELSLDAEGSLYDCGEEEESGEGADDDDDYWSRYEDPCSKYYYDSYERRESANVLASDIGLIAKQGTPGSHYTLISTDIRTAAPMAGVTFELYNYEQRLLKRVTSNSAGVSHIELEGEPRFLVARRGRERGYLELGEWNSLSLSRFDIDGQYNPNGVKGFLYGERGVWRPGDSLHITFILDDPQKVLPANHPVKFTFYDPRGQEVEKRTLRQGVDGFYSFPVATSAEAPTGSYLAEVEVGDKYFSKSFSVETVRPNRLKIEMDLGTDEVQLWKELPDVSLHSQWLHGAPASGLECQVSAAVRARSVSFPKFRDYTFEDQFRNWNTETMVITYSELDSAGNLSFPLKFGDLKEVPGKLRANIVTRVFEQSGNYSIDHFNLNLSPYPRYAGVKVENDDYSGIDPKDPIQFHLALTDPNGEPVDSGEVEISVYKSEHVWWWEVHNYDAHDYRDRIMKNLVKSEKMKLDKGIATYSLKVDPESRGNYYVRVCDEGGHCSSRSFYVGGYGWNEEEAENGAASLLFLRSEKDQYTVGETAEIIIPAGLNGRALISFESGVKVVKTDWVSVSGKETKYRFTVTRDMAPNVYAHVTLLQPHGERLNDRPLRMYGILPLEVEDPGTHLEPLIRTAAEFKPMEKAAITVREKKGRAMTYTVQIVDEGLLGLTRYHTPDPHGTMYMRMALGVRTWDLFNFVADPVFASVKGMLAVGGDGSGEGGDPSKLNRFRPVVQSLGPFRLPAGGSKTHQITLPNYVGEVRVMVVAGHDGAYGKAEKSVPVRKPLMVQASLPRVLGPGETFELPVSVFAMDPDVKEVSLRIESNSLLKAEEAETQVLRFDKPGEQVVSFRLNVAQAVGLANLKVTARAGSETSSWNVDAEVRPSAPEVEKFEKTVLSQNQQWSAEHSPFGISGTNRLTLEASRLPALNLESRLHYLMAYPHGCIEQTTSAVFPQLYLSSLTELSPKQSNMVERDIRAAIKRIKRFQTPRGGFGYWPGDYDESAYGTNYAGNFLIHAKKQGYPVPESMLLAWTEYQANAAREFTPSNYTGMRQIFNDESLFLQADRLYLLALNGKPEIGAMNRLKEQEHLPLLAKWRLAAAYHLAGRMAAAEELIRGLPRKVPRNEPDQYLYGSHDRDDAIIAECLVLLNRQQEATERIEAICKALGSGNWMSTQTAGYSLLAVGVYVHHQTPEGGMQFRYRVAGGPWKEVRSEEVVARIDLNGEQKGKVEVESLTGSQLHMRLIRQGTPLHNTEPACGSGMEIEIAYYDLQGNPINEKRLVQGTDFYAEVKVRNLREYPIQEIALSQLFPSGWQIRNPRFDGSAMPGKPDTPDYRDYRDDRVFTYFDLPEREPGKPIITRTFTVPLNASFTGTYFLPGVQCEAMYDHDTRASTGGYKVEVVPSPAS